MNEATLRRIQIREAIRAHLDKEHALFAQGIKVLSLFFIDEVAKYRDYDEPAKTRASTPECSRRNTTRSSTRCSTLRGHAPTTKLPEGHRRRQDPRGLLLDRQEDQATRSIPT